MSGSSCASPGAAWTVGVVCPPKSPALASMPAASPLGRFVVGNSLEAFTSHPEAANINALMFVAAGGDAAVLPPLFEACDKVTWVHSLFAGVDALAPFIASHLTGPGRGGAVPLTNGRGAFSESLAEYVLSGALHFNKQVRRCEDNKRNKVWDKFVMPTLAGKTFGFVGFGHIGQTTARVVKGLGCRVLALRRDPSKTSELADETLGPADKARLFAESDFVVSVLPGTPDTMDYCGAGEFALMKESAVFMSVGRGVVVDEEALADALEAGSIAGAVLDVFKVEPLPPTSRLWTAPNLLMTSHNADYTEDYFQLGWDVWSANAQRLHEGNAPATPVDKQVGY